MKVVVQRVKHSSVTVDEKIVGKIDNGLLVLVGFTYDENIENTFIKKVLASNLFCSIIVFAPLKKCTTKLNIIL